LGHVLGLARLVGLEIVLDQKRVGATFGPCG